MTLELIDFIKETDGVTAEDFPPEVTDRINSALKGLTNAENLDDEGDEVTATAIWDWHDLDAVRDNPSDEYTLVQDLTKNSPGYDEVVDPNGSGFDPIDDFTGIFDGQDNEIKDLTVKVTEGYAGLFSSLVEGTPVIRHLTLKRPDITGPNAGSLFGAADSGLTVSDISVTSATVDGTGYWAGGLAGAIVLSEGQTAEVTNIDVDANTSGTNLAGGLIGQVSAEFGSKVGNVKIDGAFTSGSVTVDGGRDVAGLVGAVGQQGGRGEVIQNAGSTASVTGSNMSASFRAPSVAGLVGYCDAESVTNCYARGAVSGPSDAKVVGLVANGGDLEYKNVYAAGDVDGGQGDAALLAVDDGREVNVVNAYYDTEATNLGADSGLNDSDSYVTADVSSLSTSEMQGTAADPNMGDLDFTDTWTTVEGDYPELQALQ